MWTVCYFVSISVLYIGVSIVFFFFFKQKTAYEMRISDWSSDVCSSDLNIWRAQDVFHGDVDGGAGCARPDRRGRSPRPQHAGASARKDHGDEIGRASCRERVCQYV